MRFLHLVFLVVLVMSAVQWESVSGGMIMSNDCSDKKKDGDPCNEGDGPGQCQGAYCVTPGDSRSLNATEFIQVQNLDVDSPIWCCVPQRLIPSLNECTHDIRGEATVIVIHNRNLAQLREEAMSEVQPLYKGQNIWLNAYFQCVAIHDDLQGCHVFKTDSVAHQRQSKKDKRLAIFS